MHPLPPDCAAIYRPIRALASGGFGAVWEVEHLHLGRRAAVKVLHDTAGVTPDQLARFAQEALVTAQLSHPHIVIVHDYGAANQVPWIAYELLPGRTLADLAAAGPVPWPRAIAIGVQVARALACAHAASVLHRDVKPENILEAAPGHFKVADFGIARWAASSQVRTATGVILGTPSYLAPEVIQGAPASVAADLYALAVVLHELISGRPLFTGEKLWAILDAHLSSTPPALTGVPRNVARLIAQGLAKDPALRPASAAAFADELEASEGASTPAPTQTIQVVRSTSRTRALNPQAERSAPVAEEPRARVPGAAIAALAVAGLALAAALGLRSPSAPRTPPTPSVSPALSAARAALENAYAAPDREAAYTAALETCARAGGLERETLWAWDALHPGIAAVTARALEAGRIAPRTMRDLIGNVVEPPGTSPHWLLARATRRATHVAELLRAPAEARNQTNPAHRPAAELFGLLQLAMRRDGSTACEMVPLVATAGFGARPLRWFLQATQAVRMERVLLLAALRRVQASPGLEKALRELLANRPSPPPAPGPALPTPLPNKLVLPPALIAKLEGPEEPKPECRRLLDDLNRDLAGTGRGFNGPRVKALVSHLINLSRDAGDAVAEATLAAAQAWLAGWPAELRDMPTYWQARAEVTILIDPIKPEFRVATVDWGLLSLELSFAQLRDNPPTDPLLAFYQVFNAYESVTDLARRIEGLDPDRSSLADQLAESGHVVSESDRPAPVLLRGAAAAALVAATRAFPMPPDPTHEVKYPASYVGLDLRFVARLVPHGLLDASLAAEIRALAERTRKDHPGDASKEIDTALETLNRPLIQTDRPR